MGMSEQNLKNSFRHFNIVISKKNLKKDTSEIIYIRNRLIDLENEFMFTVGEGCKREG